MKVTSRSGRSTEVNKDKRCLPEIEYELELVSLRPQNLIGNINISSSFIIHYNSRVR